LIPRLLLSLVLFSIFFFSTLVLFFLFFSLFFSFDSKRRPRLRGSQSRMIRRRKRGGRRRKGFLNSLSHEKRHRIWRRKRERRRRERREIELCFRDDLLFFSFSLFLSPFLSESFFSLTLSERCLIFMLLGETR